MGSIDDATNTVAGRLGPRQLPAMGPTLWDSNQCVSGQTYYLSIPPAALARGTVTGFETLPKSVRTSDERIRVEVSHAHSPAAKGRIERLFATLQDRLVKEMRLARVASLAKPTDFWNAILSPPPTTNAFGSSRPSPLICIVGCPPSWIS